jgi:hypothetical protein
MSAMSVVISNSITPTNMAAARTSYLGQKWCHAMYWVYAELLYGDRLRIMHLTFVREAESRK